MVVRVPDSKRQELVDALKTLPVSSSHPPDAVDTHQSIDDTRVSWQGQWHSEAEARAFLDSDAYGALRGAARFLGELLSLDFGEVRHMG
jgi:hypothetical protein